MSESTPKFADPPNFEERLEKYDKGGYHPTNLGDIFNGRYVVIGKLGWGIHSTVWLVEDQRLVQSSLHITVNSDFTLYFSETADTMRL